MENRKFYSGLDAVYLVSCAVNGRVPERKALDNMDYEALIKQLKRHSLQAMAYLAVKMYQDECGKIPSELSSEVFSGWEAVYKRTMQSAVLYSMEREKLFAFFEDKGIWYLPLKGIYLQNFYPQLGMRQMADNDVYFDINYRKELKNYMVENGYTVHTYGLGIHDTYMKPPFFNFEMHAYLYRESVNEVFDRYYQNVKERLIKDENNKCGYHFSDEDFYIHMLTHIHKHYFHGGLGLRFLCDLYVFLVNKESTMDWEYIKGELVKLEIDEFEPKLRNLSMKLFSPECPFLRDDIDYLTDDEKTELSFFVTSGIYGTKERAVRSDMKKLTGNEDEGVKNKLRYILSRLFPGKLYYKENYPFLYKYKIFIPFFLAYRLFRGIFLRTKGTLDELKALNRKHK